ncbi:MAG: hypothetical protein NVS1B3_04170 [Candidatus Dormibacteraceae bacterium]
MNDFERDLQDELHRILDPMTAGPIPARRVTATSGGTMKRLLGGAGAALSVKIVTGLAVAAMAATAAVAATEVATTGSINPANWGQKVKEQVELCKDQLPTGEHGIGKCVSSFARQHGDAVSDKHQDGGSDKDKDKDRDKDKDKDKPKDKDKDKDKPKSRGQGSDNTPRPPTSVTVGSSALGRSR